MDVKIDSPNAITLRLDPGETLYHPMRFLRSRGFGARLIAPWPLRAPLGRLWHRAYRMGVLSAPLTGDALTAPRGLGPNAGIYPIPFLGIDVSEASLAAQCAAP